MEKQLGRKVDMDINDDEDFMINDDTPAVLNDPSKPRVIAPTFDK